MIVCARKAREMLRYWMELADVRPRRSFGLNGLDLKLHDHIRFRNGFFVEAGGNDGVAQSNTLYFERYHGWRGLLIEPVPELAAQCKSNRPKSIVEQCALVSRTFSEPVIEIQYCNLMSLIRGARGSAVADEAHLAEGRKYLSSGDKPYSVKVPAITLSSVLDSHGVQRVDLLSLDVEGYEAEVLRGLDFDRHAPRFIVVEANDPDDVEETLAGRYDLVTQISHHDRLYRLKDKLVR